MCDKYTDVVIKKQLIFCLPWVNKNLKVHQKFLGFYYIPDNKCAIIVSVMKDTLIRYQLSPDSCREVLWRRKQYVLKCVWGCSTNKDLSVTCILFTLPHPLAITSNKGCYKNYQNFKGYCRRDHCIYQILS